jgi:hypothetical protein
VFVSQFDRCFVVRIEFISAAAATTTTKVADTEWNPVISYDDGLEYGRKLNDVPLQLVAVFVTEDDVHPGGDYVEGALIVWVIIIRFPRRESTSFERLTGNLMCHRSVTQPRPLDST